MKDKKINSILIFAVLIIIGVMIILYPVVTRVVSKYDQEAVINQYLSSFDGLSLEEIKEKNSLVESYNKQIENGEVNSKQDSLFETSDVFGYIEIPKINVVLPIYEGTSDEALTMGVGHIENTSMPTSNGNANVGLTAHRGLPTSILFSDLDKMEKGDSFYVTVLNQKYKYIVKNVLVVLPENIQYLNIEENKNLATLITCTPYMINTHRLIVIGEFDSVEDKTEEFSGKYIKDKKVIRAQDIKSSTSNSYQGSLENNSLQLMYFLFMFYLVLLIIVLLLIYFIFRKNTSNEKKERRNEKIRRVIVGLIIITSIIVLLLPTIIKNVNQKEIKCKVQLFESKIEEEKSQDEANGENSKYNLLLSRIKEYNEKIRSENKYKLIDPFIFTSNTKEVESLGFIDNQVGSIYIESINLTLPIFVGDEGENLLRGAINVNGSSLPIGGENTNTVIAAHRGLEKNKMFRNIDKIKLGDIVEVKNYWETLKYEVYDTKIVYPSEIENITIQEGRDILTLITCHPLKLNNKRYIVYCKRVEN